jgi:hypothetical protein
MNEDERYEATIQDMVHIMRQMIVTYGEDQGLEKAQDYADRELFAAARVRVFA